MAIKITCLVTAEGDEKAYPSLMVHSSTKGLKGSRVVLEWTSNNNYFQRTFLATDLIAAIQNCQNT